MTPGALQCCCPAGSLGSQLEEMVKAITRSPIPCRRLTVVLPSWQLKLRPWTEFLAVSQGAHPLKRPNISAAQQVANHLHSHL